MVPFKQITRLLTSLFAAASLSMVYAQDKAENEPLPLDELQVFAEVFGKIKNEYVDEASDVDLLRDAIQGMLNGLDPHSTFLEPEAFKEVRISTEGKFGGLGIEVTTEDGLIKVVAPIDGTPAADADIRSGDIIVMIDGKPVRGMDLRDAVDSMRGEPGTQIVLTISREDTPELIEMPLIRAIIKVASVRGEMLENGFAYARISSFQSGTSNNLRTQIDKLMKQNDGELDGLILDLRNNPGGVLNSAVDVSDHFLEQGNIVATRGRDSTMDTSYRARPGDILDGAPLVVLVNGGSASASEIVAGALQDHERAIIMGTRTFGKGSVQTVIPMNNGGALKLTTARYYTPNDRSIQARGIEPDIEVKQRELSEPGQDGKMVRESDLAGHLSNGDDADSVEDETEATEGSKKEKLELSKLIKQDYQLSEALNLLKGMSLVRSRLMAEPN
ncbi:MAG: S41 family peptidase [Arenicellales bacterium]